MQRSIDYYESAMSQPPCNGLIVATTHGWQDHGCSHLGEMLALPVRPIKDEMRALFNVRLHDPDPQDVDWDNILIEQRNALTSFLRWVLSGWDGVGLWQLNSEHERTEEQRRMLSEVETLRAQQFEQQQLLSLLLVGGLIN